MGNCRRTVSDRKDEEDRLEMKWEDKGQEATRQAMKAHNEGISFLPTPSELTLELL